MTTMTAEEWDAIAYFNPSEKWGDPLRMDRRLITELVRLRKYIRRPIHIHCGYEARDGVGYHPQGMAVDCHADDLHPMEFFIAAARFDFNGLGVYLWWNNPGLHLDVRPVPAIGHRAVWGSTGPKIYVPFDRAFIARAMAIQAKGGAA